MKILVVADDLIFPNNSGGRAEVLGNTEALRSAGHEVAIIMMQREDISVPDLEKNLTYSQDVQIFKRHSFLKSSFTYPWMPYQLSSRIWAELDISRYKDFDLVIAHHEYAIPTAEKISSALKIPLILRSHNDEIKYLKSLYRGNTNYIKKLYFLAELVRAKICFTEKFYKNVSHVATISDSDQKFYQERGIKVRTAAPSLAINALEDNKRVSRNGKKLVFAGTLDVAITREGLRWFVDEVLPKLTAYDPEITLTIMGRRAPHEFVSSMEQNNHIDFLGEVDSIEDNLLKSTVFINPIFGGSGVNMKMGPPASIGLPIVSTSTGARGLEGLSAGITLADSANTFYESIVKLLEDESFWKQQSANLLQGIRSFAPIVVANQTLNETDINDCR